MTQTPLPAPVSRHLPRALLTLLPLGLAAVLGLLPTLPAMLGPLTERTPGAPPMATLLAVTAAQLTVLVALSVAAGAWAAPRAGFRSRLVDRDWAALRADARAALLLGLLTGAVIVALDRLTGPLLGDAWARAAAGQERTLAVTVSGMLYGGIGEELQMRWALVSVLTVGLWRMFQRHSVRPTRAVILTAVLVVAALFGIGHLGAVAALVPLTPAIVARTVLLNAVGGVVYGLLFTRRSLESAMVAHAVTHVAMTALTLLL